MSDASYTLEESKNSLPPRRRAPWRWHAGQTPPPTYTDTNTDTHMDMDMDVDINVRVSPYVALQARLQTLCALRLIAHCSLLTAHACSRFLTGTRLGLDSLFQNCQYAKIARCRTLACGRGEGRRGLAVVAAGGAGQDQQGRTRTQKETRQPCCRRPLDSRSG